MNLEQQTTSGSGLPHKTDSNMMVPSLEIKGKIIAEAVPKGVNHGDQVQKYIDQTKVSDSNSQFTAEQPQNAPKKKPFIPPLTGAKNLGFSTLMNEDGKTQEELDVETQI